MLQTTSGLSYNTGYSANYSTNNRTSNNMPKFAAIVCSVNRIIPTIGKQINTCKVAVGTKIGGIIRINKPTNLRIVITAGYVIESRLSDHKPEPLRLEAINVMLELSNGYPIRFSAVHDEDILLRFALGSDPPRQYTVATYSDAAAEVETGKNIVWISLKRLMPENLSLAKQQFYAQCQEDGSHRFFGANQ